MLAVACALYGLQAIRFSSWIIDDAFVTFRYAHNLVRGLGLVFNPGEHVEGYTNFSWVLLAALGMKLGFSPTSFMPALGAMAGVAAIVVVAHTGRRLAERAGEPHELAGLPAAVLLALTPSLAFYAVSGLETVLFTLLVTAAASALALGRARSFAALAVAALLTRPEAALLALWGGVPITVVVLRSTGAPRRRALVALGMMVLPTLVYLLFKKWYFGSLAPNTLLAKPPSVRAGLRYVASEVPALAGLALAAIMGAVVDLRSLRSRARDREAVAMAPVAQLVLLWCAMTGAVALVGGDFMPAHRMLLPSLGVGFLAADKRLLAWAKRPLSARDWAGAIALVAAAFYLPVVLDEGEAIAAKCEGMAAAEPGRVRAAKILAQKGVKSIGTFDVGRLGYEAPDARIVDLGGLTDRRIAESPGYYFDKRPDSAYLEALAPDAYLFTSIAPPNERAEGVEVPPHYLAEAYVRSLPWFDERYAYAGTFVATESYFLHWFARKDAPRPMRALPPAIPLR